MNDQNNTDDTNESSNSSMLSRSAQMIQAASPYLDETMKNALESIVHVTDFLETMQTFRQKGFSSMFSGLFGGRQKNGDTVSMANLSSSAAAIDTESILRSIRPFCTQNEGSLIDQILNMLNMQKVFKMYQTMQSMMSMMNMTNENATQSSDATPPNQETSNVNTDSSTYYDTYWNSFHNNNNGNTNTYSDSNTYENSEFSYYTDNNTSTNFQGNNQEFSQNPNSYDYNNTFTNNSPNNSSDNNSTSTDHNSNSTSNTQMLDMLSSLIPPEQKNTFDAMKLLLESGMLK